MIWGSNFNTILETFSIQSLYTNYTISLCFLLELLPCTKGRWLGEGIPQNLIWYCVLHRMVCFISCHSNENTLSFHYLSHFFFIQILFCYSDKSLIKPYCISQLRLELKKKIWLTRSFSFSFFFAAKLIEFYFLFFFLLFFCWFCNLFFYLCCVWLTKISEVHRRPMKNW